MTRRTAQEFFWIMRFIAPEYLYTLVVTVPAVLAALWYAAWRRRRELEALFADPGAARAALKFSPAARALRIVFLCAAMLAAAVAAARPYWKSHPQTVSERGRDIVVVFDVSRSMLAQDLPPSRLEHAKFLLRQLAQKFPGDRLALVAFAGEAYAACPLTADPVAFEEYVDELTPDLVQRGGTDLEKALRKALKCLKGAAGTQAVVLLTDGDELTGSGRRTIDEFKRRGIPVCVVGLGDPAAATPLPDETGALRRDAKGKLITSRLNEPELRRLAEETGGVYVRSTVADTGADAVAAQLARLTATDHGERTRELPEERFDWFVALAAVLLAVSLLISERSRGTPVRKMLMLLIILLATAPGARAEAEEPRPVSAAPAEDAEIMAAKTPEELYNLGLKRQQAGDAAGAQRCYESVLRQPDETGRSRAKALFNLGAAEHQAARSEFDAARKQVAAQQLDPALAKLKAARGRLGRAREFYGAALAGAGAAALDDDNALPTDLRLREADLKRIEELEKQIEELKKQQQQARQSAQNAQQQNQQQQNQKQQNQQQQKDQQQQQNQQNQQQKEEQQQQNQQQKDQQSQQQGSDRRDAIRDAAAASEKLEKSAEQLGQQKLKEQAQRAAEELRRAEAAPDPKTAQPHLDRAVRELGGDEKPDEERKSGNEEKQNGGERKESEKEQKKSGEEKSGEEQKQNGAQPLDEEPDKSADRKGAEQLLELLNDGEKRHREELNRRRRLRRPPVEKDW